MEAVLVYRADSGRVIKLCVKHEGLHFWVKVKPGHAKQVNEFLRKLKSH